MTRDAPTATRESVGTGAFTDSALRRCVDVVSSVIGLVVLLPFFLTAAIAVKLDSAGPVFYVAERLGRGGIRFGMLKFRSMVRDAAALGPGVSGDHDPRTTRVGRILRATRLDELPQLVNVLRGDMTLIGPRPEAPQYLPHYTPAERRLLDVRPGITGPGQLHFARSQAALIDEASDADQIYVDHLLHPKLALDLGYLRSRSLRADLGVLAATVRSLDLRRRSPTGQVTPAR